MKKTLSDGFIIKRGFRIDLLNDGYLIMNSKEFEVLEPNIIVVEGKLNSRKNVMVKIYTDEVINNDDLADKIFSKGWDHWEIKKL